MNIIKAKNNVLCIDIGNTTVKFGYFEIGRAKSEGPSRWVWQPSDVCRDDKLKKVLTFKAFKKYRANKDFNKYDAVIVSSVNKKAEKYILSSCDRKKLLVIGKDIKISNLPLKFNYENIKSLGADRICFAFYSFKKFGKNILNVSLGSATVIDYIDKSGRFAGGVIIPGISTQFKSLESFDRLKRIKFINVKKKKFGNSTNECISLGITIPIIKLIEFYKEKTNSKYVIFSGGDYSKIKDLLPQDKNHIYEPNAVILGTYYIYKSLS